MIREFFRSLWAGMTGRDNGAFAATRTCRILEYVLLAACGGMFTWAFPGVDLSPLVWIGLVPVFLLTVRHSAWSAFTRSYVWGFCWNFTAFFWLREIALPIPVAAGFVLGFFPAVWAVLNAWMYANLSRSVTSRLKGECGLESEKPFSSPWRSLIFLFASASVWCLTEWVRGWIFTGLPWNYLSAAQWKNLILIQICEYTGTFGVSFVIALLNIGLAMSLPIWRDAIRDGRYRRPLPLMAAGVVLALAVGAGWHLFSVQQRKMKNGENTVHRIGVVQCALSQRRFAGESAAVEALDVCLNLSRKLLEEKDRPELIVWPETAVPYAWRGASELSERYRREIGYLLMRYQVPFLIGSLDFELTSEAACGFYVYNAALLLQKPGTEPADSFRKTHLVPFGEYVPFGDEFPVLCRIVGMGRNLSAGTRYNPLEAVPGVRAGTSICFESVFPEISRRHVLNGANLLLVISNDAWYPTSNEPTQHFANSVFRAVENRLPLLRSGNQDFSAVISPSGAVTDCVTRMKLPNGRFRFAPEVKTRTAAVLSVPVPNQHQPTFYTRYGNVFLLLCAVFSVLGLVPSFTAWRDFRGAQADPERCRKIIPERSDHGK